MTTDTGSAARGNGWLETMAPSLAGGTISPAPPAKDDTTDPAFAGLSGRLNVPSWLIADTSIKVPSPFTNNSGMAGSTATLETLELTPPTSTTTPTVALPAMP